MKFMEKWNVKNNIRDCISFLIGLWTFAMLTVFPLYFGHQYEEIGAHKFQFFSMVSGLFILPAVILAILLFILQGNLRHLKTWFLSLSILDKAMGLYLIAVILSWQLSQFPDTAWEGTGGWFMGARSQLIFVAVYFLISRFLPFSRLLVYGHFIGSSLVFLFGILHRFLIDPLQMYRGLDEGYYIWYLSTIGQSTWYSSYVCTVFPLGICAYFLSKKTSSRILSALYCMLGFMTLVTQNSDSAFMALALLFFALFFIACDSYERMGRFLEILILMFLSFKTMGLLQWAFYDRAIQLGSLSTFFSQSAFSWIGLLLAAVLYIVLLHFEQKAQKKRVSVSRRTVKTGGKTGAGSADSDGDGIAFPEKATKIMRRTVTGLLGGTILAGVSVIWLNTTGVFQKLFGVTIQNQYLLFDESWGSDRGFNWRIALEPFENMNLKEKLFGIGPDSFYRYVYRIPELAEKLNDHWPGQTLTNAHNEFLNMLVCLGIVGLLAFLFLLGSAVVRFFKNRQKTAYGLVGVLVIASYVGHNVFCYEQVCCTPFLFLGIGLAEAFLSNPQKPLPALSPLSFWHKRKQEE